MKRYQINETLIFFRRDLLTIKSWLGQQNTQTASLQKGETPPLNECSEYDI